MISLPYKREENVSSSCQPGWLLLEFRGATPDHTAAYKTHKQQRGGEAESGSQAPAAVTQPGVYFHP